MQKGIELLDKLQPKKELNVLMHDVPKWSDIL